MTLPIQTIIDTHKALEDWRFNAQEANQVIGGVWEGVIGMIMLTAMMGMFYKEVSKNPSEKPPTSRQLSASNPRIEQTSPIIMYHVTASKYWPSIEQHGLKPSLLGDGSGRSGIYLSTSEEKLIDKFVRFGFVVQDSLIEEGALKERQPFAILEVKIPKGTHLEPDPQAEGWGFIAFGNILPNKVKKIREIWDV